MLREAGFTTVRAEGTRRIYAVRAEALHEVDEWLTPFRRFWEPRLAALETEIARHTAGCKAGGSAELWTINGGGHGPAVSDHFSRLVVEWLLGHPKP